MTNKDKEKRTRREITLDWPDPPIQFQEINMNWEPKFPCLMIPWGGGRQVIYSVDDQNTFFKNTPPAWWYYPDTISHVSGEEYRLGMGAAQFWLAMLINLTNPESGGVQIDAASFLINDIYQAELDANARAAAMINLPVQPLGVSIARPVQVTDVENFNRYLESFKNSGYIGALVRNPRAMYHDPQHGVISEITEGAK